MNIDRIFLKECRNNKIPFQAGNIDVFAFKTRCINDIERIKIGHEGSYIGEWKLESVEISIPEKKVQILFECNQWFGRYKDVKEKEFSVTQSHHQKTNERPNNKMTIYRIAVATSDIQFAGTVFS
jgi:hypothetical protein